MEKLDKAFLAGEYTQLDQQQAELLTKSPTVPELSVVLRSLLPPSTSQTHHPPKQCTCICTQLKKMLTKAGVYQCIGFHVCLLRF